MLKRRNSTSRGSLSPLSLSTKEPKDRTMPRTTSITENKKKLGKNLNKLVVKPAEQSTGNQQQRNGLLLMSAQKKSSGGLLASSNKSSSPTASNSPPSSQQHQQHHSSKAFEASKTSTHDALLSAVTAAGKSDRGGEHTVAHDAWGVAGAAERQQQQQQQQKSSEAVVNETLSAVIMHETTEPKVTSVAPEMTAATPSKTETTYDTLPVTAAIAGPSWDEYGGRDRGGRGQLVDVGTEERMSSTSSREQTERLSHRERDRGEAGELWEPPASSHSRGGGGGAAAAAVAARESSSSSSPRVDPEQPPATTSAPAMIHLKNYEDRDRGERPNSSAPRMLYDPKSGSMVEVKEKEERKKVRGRKRRERSAGWSAARKAEKAEAAKFVDGNPKTDVSKLSRRQDNGAVILKKKNLGIRERRLPRTCGVLYERDEKGQIYCADGCEGGDLGYGAHSVPGGRARNRDAYRQYQMYQEELTRSDVNGPDGIDSMGMVDFGGGTHVYSMYNSSYRVDSRTVVSYDADDTMAAGEVALQTGFHPATRMAASEEQTPEMAPMEWVKAGDKLELVTGIDDSPTLKPTAKEWAPSHAALAAAAQAAASRGKNIMDRSFDSEEDDKGIEEALSDEDSSGAFGLGFDPTKHMDGLMQSPSHTGGDMDGVAPLVASVDLDALNLEPPMFQSASKNDRDVPSGPGHIFAFGTSGTWGSKAPAGSSSDDWGSAAPTGDYASTFLSLPSGTNTWGLPGMGGLSSNGDSSVGKGSIDE